MSGKVRFRYFFDSLKGENIEEVIDLMSWIVSTFSYADHPELLKAAYTNLAHYRVTEHLYGFKLLREQWQDTYLSQYDYLLALFTNGLNGAICNCSVYQDGKFNVPPYQDDLDILVERKRDEGACSFDVFDVRCKICGTEWEVEVDYIYHYPHSHWRKI
ncbi:MAG: hypothetical protein ACFFEJ_10795 [Candidatus Thorarchaeota archaeon]